MSQIKKELNKIKEMYESGNNIINKYSHEGLRDAIMVSYDLQAGSYNSYDEDNPETREKIRDNYFSKESLLLYPIIEMIPCLLPENAIIATHYLDEFS
jgi:uncharacterized protein YbaR (Trm112 family)